MDFHEFIQMYVTALGMPRHPSLTPTSCSLSEMLYFLLFISHVLSPPGPSNSAEQASSDGPITAS